MTVLRDLSWAVCAICGDEADGWGYAPGDASRIMWTCEPCLPLARKTYHMAADKRSKLDKDAIAHAGEKGGEYLETLGKTDLAVLTPEEWATFLATIFRARAAELRRLNADGAPPF